MQNKARLQTFMTYLLLMIFSMYFRSHDVPQLSEILSYAPASSHYRHWAQRGVATCDPRKEQPNRFTQVIKTHLKPVKNAYLEQAMYSCNQGCIIGATDTVVPTSPDISANLAIQNPTASHTRSDTPLTSLTQPSFARFACQVSH